MSTTLAEIEQAYYEAIADAKVTELDEYDTGSLRYSKDAFIRWARQIDIYDLEKDKADFTLTKETEDEFGEYRREVEDELRKSFQYVQPPYSGVSIKGTLENIGSCHDGSKVETMDEVDSFYVLESDNIKVQPVGSHTVYKIFYHDSSTKFEIEARKMRNQFADACDKIIAELPLPPCLRHGGYNSPQHSGVRYNGPAATPQFLTKGDALLTLDMTPTFRLPRKENIYREVRTLLDPIRNVISDKMLDKTDIHLIPDAGENLWRLSTAHLEANILRILPTVAPMKHALSYCKILLSKLKKWNTQNCDGFTSKSDPVFCCVMTQLDKYMDGECKSHDVAQQLNKELRYAHVWIPLEKRKKYHEDQKSYISINNAAVKYILLSAALKQPETFSGKENIDLVIKLMKHVFEVLGDTSHVSSPHTFLTMINVPHLSVLASRETNKMAAAGWLIKEQCRTLRLETMTVVGKYTRSFFTIEKNGCNDLKAVNAAAQFIRVPLSSNAEFCVDLS